MARREQEMRSAVEYVQMDGLALLKIIKHCETAGSTNSVQGVLIGMVEDNKVEVTYAFPLSVSEFDPDGSHYDMEMMKLLRDINMDYLHVGWYQSTYFGSFINQTFIESQYVYQRSIEDCIVLNYDPIRTANGHLAIKAMRLSPKMARLYGERDFSPEKLKESGLTFQKMFEEIPIIIKNSHLVNSLCCELDDLEPVRNKYEFLNLATSSVLEKNLKMLIECVDDLSQDANKFFNYQRQSAKQAQAKQQYIQRRQSENASRVARGEDPLPDDDINKVFKPLAAPSRLESLLLANQVTTYADQVNAFAAQSFGKLFMAESLQDGKPASK